MRGRRAIRRIAAGVLAALGVFLVLSAAAVAVLRWVDPPGSAVMAWHWIGSLAAGRERPFVHHQWTPWSDIAPHVPLAVVAAEDQRFPEHRGFDLVELENAWRDYREGGRLRGASTISQQVAKNLFLWNGRSLARKGLEAWLTFLIESFWPKRRILEVYLNVAEMGPDTYGVGAASWRWFHRPPEALGPAQAALMAAVLPNPRIYRLDAPSRQVEQRAAWVRGQMRRLGEGYLGAL